MQQSSITFLRLLENLEDWNQKEQQAIQKEQYDYCRDLAQCQSDALSILMQMKRDPMSDSFFYPELKKRIQKLEYIKDGHKDILRPKMTHLREKISALKGEESQLKCIRKTYLAHIRSDFSKVHSSVEA